MSDLDTRISEIEKQLHILPGDKTQYKVRCALMRELSTLEEMQALKRDGQSYHQLDWIAGKQHEAVLVAYGEGILDTYPWWRKLINYMRSWFPKRKNQLLKAIVKSSTKESEC